MSVIIVKLVNEEELIAELLPDEETKEEIMLDNPAKIAIVPHEDGNVGVALLPWIPYTKGRKFLIKKQHILCMVEPISDMANQYRVRFGRSGIVIPDKGGIIT